MFRIFHALFVLLVVALGAIGLARLNFNVDILGLLPADLPGVAGTAAFQRFSDQNDELMVTVASAAGEDTGDLADSLAERLAATPGLAVAVESEPKWRTAPAGLVELTAQAWLNAPPERLLKLEADLNPGRIDALLKARVGKISEAFDPMTTALESRDPLGFGGVLREFGTVGGQSDGGDGFASGDGCFHLIKVAMPQHLRGYREIAGWLGQVKTAVAAWQRDEPGAAELKIAYTGSPAFEAEIGTGMERDMGQSISGITLVVGLLFWLLHRRFMPLIYLMVAMLVTGLLTLGVAGVTFGSLDVMSMGFAAILMGMIEDFGVMGLHETMRRPGADFRAIHAGVFPSLAWSAVSSAALFGVLGLSSLPGIARMGILTAMGILIGAAVMLYGFLPLVMRHPGARPEPRNSGHVRFANWPGWLALVLALASAGVLALRGGPDSTYGTGMLRPRQCHAFEALTELQHRLQPGRAEAHWVPVIVRGETAVELAAATRGLEKRLSAAVTDGSATGYMVPSAMVPDPARQALNMPVLVRLAGARDRLVEALDGAGFSAEGMEFSRKVLEMWDQWGRDPGPSPRWPTAGLVDQYLGPVMKREAAGGSVCGFVLLPMEVDPGGAEVLTELQRQPGVLVGGLDYLAGQLRVLLRGEVKRVLIPAVILLGALLFVVFKSARERLMVVASLVFSGLLLLGAMRAAGISWNFVNIGAVPLALGLGLDFNIHMIHALRERGADGHGIGRALAYCGLSTGLGFGALGLADNAGLASFGQTAMIGVLATLLTAAYLVPWAWRRLGV